MVTKMDLVTQVKAELRKDKVKEATAALKVLYKRQEDARKILRNIDREIEDYLDELKIDEDDTSDA